MDWISKAKYPKWAMVNFIVLTTFGLLLRYNQLYTLPGINYQFILHAHSHFAFAGWMFFSIAMLITHAVSDEQYASAYKYVFVFALISAYGMLISFSFQGYQLLSICFSTLFILVTYRFTYLIIKGGRLKEMMNTVSRKLIYGTLIFLCLSSLGPFALGPLMAKGFRNTPLYQDAIYFYLHFQMNGFMFLAALGLFASTYLTGHLNRSIKVWLNLFIYSTIPLYFIFTLWAKPVSWIWALAILGTCINLVNWIKLCWYFKRLAHQFSFLANAALIAITLKIIFQVLICVPAIGEWTFANRNLIIGYIHLLTLGCVMPLILDQFIKRGFLINDKYLSIINWLYITFVVIYLVLLFIQPLLSLFLIMIPQYQFILFVCCIFFLLIGVGYLIRVKGYSHLN